MYYKNSCQAKHIWPPSRISDRLAERVWPPSRIPERLARHVRPPTQIPESLAGHVWPSPEHARVFEGIGLPIYRPIYQLGRLIFGRFWLVSTRRRRFLRRPTRRHAPHPIPGRIRPLFTPPPRFSSTAYPPSHPAWFIGSAADYCLIPIGFWPASSDFRPPGPASAPLSTGANGE
jgi:hypothetical protein